MCARTTLAASEKVLLENYAALEVEEPYEPSYNTAPGMNNAVITADRPDIIQQYHFGLVPHWAKDTKIGYNMVNARAETVMELPSFKPLMVHTKRCLVLADGFYEWEQVSKTNKVPYRFVIPEREVFAFAGLYSHWLNPETKYVYRSFTIITTTPNQVLSQIHHRMPVILSKEEEKLWLAKDIPAKEVLPMLDEYPADEMKMYKVSKDVNVARNNHADLILPANSQ